jgi:adenosylcobinamide-GDP ribazoletransferase
LSSAFATLRFLSRIPIPGDASSDLERIHAAWFPIAGLIIGVLVALADLALSPMQWGIRNALVVLVGVCITGALHVDALMDTADGLAAPRAEITSAIHASVHSAEAVAIGMLALVLSWLALYQIHDPHRTQWLLCAPMLGRVAIIAGYQAFRPAIQAGPATFELFRTARTPMAVMAVVAAVCILLVMLTSPLPLIIASIVVVVTALLLRWRNNGLGGDHYGALAVVTELSFLFSAASLSQAFSS